MPNLSTIRNLLSHNTLFARISNQYNAYADVYKLGRFVQVPSVYLQRLAQYFRASMVAFFLRRSLINLPLARSMLDWTHSGLSLDLSVKIPATSTRTREALAHYIARPPLSP